MRKLIHDIQEYRLKKRFLVELAQILRDDKEKAEFYCEAYERYIVEPPKPFDLNLNE